MGERFVIMVQVLQIIVGIAMIVAIMRIFSIDATLKKILEALEKADKSISRNANNIIRTLTGGDQ